MYHSCTICSKQNFNFEEFLNYIGPSSQIVLWCQQQNEGIEEWYFYRKGHSTTCFIIQFASPDLYSVCMDYLASASDYRFYPYLLDSMAQYLNSRVDELEEKETLYSQFNEEWMEEMIGEEIAQLKATLTLVPKYYISITLPHQPFAYVSTDALKRYGVCLTSSTPRIYGYVQYMLNNDHIPRSTYDEMLADSAQETEEVYDVEVPQHHSIGKVLSWQLDGSETTESYGEEDVELLLSIAREVEEGAQYEGVVLNDIGTIYQEGIGIASDYKQAARWFEKAYEAGDHLYAPTNLGDLYRKGSQLFTPDLQKAFLWYLKSEDPYSWYRIGQAYEEGWIETPDLILAMQWYKKAANAGHHLAIQRLKTRKQYY